MLAVGIAVVVTVLVSFSPVIAAPGALADTIPLSVSIGDGATSDDYTYLNAQFLADNLVFTNLVVQASASITVVDPIDLSTSAFGLPIHSLTLTAPVCNIAGDFNFESFGRLFLTCGTLNLNAPITSGGAPIAADRVPGTATQVNVLSDAASIQQGIDGSSPSSPVTVNVGAGHYTENLTISHALTLRGNDGTAATGADPGAPVLVGTQPGGSIITVTANNVAVDGMHLSGTVNGDSSTRSASGIVAGGVDALTVTHNTFEGFSGPAIQASGSTDVLLDANGIVPTLLSTAITPADPTVAAGTDQQLTDTGSYSEGPAADLTSQATWTSSDPTVATVNAAGIAHAVSAGTSTITAAVLGLIATTDLVVDPASAQSISFTSSPPVAAVVGGTYAVTATASSGLPVTFTIDPTSSAGACTISGSTVSFTGVGTCVIDANQPGNATYPAAAQVAESVTVGKSPQTITFASAPPATPTVGGVYPVSATASSGLAVRFAIGASTTAGACSISGATVTFTGAGTCIINANQPGNLNYRAAPQVRQLLTVSPTPQPPTFTQASPPLTAFAGAAYLYAFAASGSPAPTYALATGAPSWLSLDANSGLLSGTPPAGTTSFTYSLTASNTTGQANTGPFTVAAAPLPRAALRANLAITLSCPSSAKVNTTIKCKAVVTNNGPATAASLKAAIVLPASFTALSPTPSATIIGRQVLWNGGSLSNGASSTFTVTAKATTAGTATITAATWSVTADANLPNNIRQKSETISNPS